MGMFDDIRIEGGAELPEHLVAGRWYQTKDLDCRLDRYTITQGGRLARDDKEGGVDYVPHHGDIYFYTFADEKASKGWVQFVARFTEGLLTRVWLDRYEAPE